MARSAAVAAGAPVGTAAEATERDLTLAFVALELQLSSLAQEALADGALGSMRTRRLYHNRAQRLIAHMRGQSMVKAKEVLESAYDSGVRLAGHRPMGLVRRQSLAAITTSATERLDSSLVTVGRRFDDAFRQAGLKAAARQLTEREMPEAAAAAAMRQELMGKGLTGFVDKSGRNWRLQNYTRMVVRTTTAEAANRGVADAVLTVGRDLVRISVPENHHCHHHPSDPANPCRALEGKTVSLTGHTPGYPILEAIPPFHPNCQHGIAPAPELVPA